MTSGGNTNSLVLRGALVVHTDPPRVLMQDIRVEGGDIVGLGPALPERAGESVIDLTGKWILPGFVCTQERLFAAFARRASIENLLPLGCESDLVQLGDALDARGIFLSTVIGGLEALRCGVTTVVGPHHWVGRSRDVAGEQVEKALRWIGLRAVSGLEESWSQFVPHFGTIRQSQAAATFACGVHPQMSSTVNESPFEILSDLQAVYRHGTAAGLKWSVEEGLGVLTGVARMADSTLESTLGCIRKGAAADLVVVQPTPGLNVDASTVAQVLMDQLRSENVEGVMVAGQWSWWDGFPTAEGLDDLHELAQISLRSALSVED